MKESNRITDSRIVSIPISEKYMLTVKEAGMYFNIGIKKMRRLAEENTDSFAIVMGNRYLIIRTRFEEYIDTLINDTREVQQSE